MKKIVPVWPWPMHPKVAAVLEAIPDVNLVEAVPSGPGPVLAIKTAPPFVCDAIVLMRPEKAAEAIDIITGNGLLLQTRSDILGAAFNGEVVPIETTASKPRVTFK